MKPSEVNAELALIRARFCSGAMCHEFNKTVIALELAASCCDEQGNIILEDRVKQLLNSLNRMAG